MDPIITTLLQILFGGVTGVIITEFFRSLRNAKRGQKEQLDNLRESRNKFRSLFLRWRDHAFHVRSVALRNNVPRDEIGQPPDDEH